MERIIKFRAQDEDKIWHFGNYDQDNQEIFYTHIDADGCHRAHIPIVPCTVGEFSGFKDIDGVEIYEGDILKGADLIVKVVWENGHFLAYDLDEISDYLDFLLNTFRLKVIGNIHDNPELLEVGK